MTQKFAVGDLVRQTSDKYTTTKAFGKGNLLEISEVLDGGRRYMAGPIGHDRSARHEVVGGSLYFQAYELEAQEPLAEWEKELLGIKVEEKVVEQLSAFKVGDRVVALEDYSYDVKKGETYTVRSVENSNVEDTNGMIALEGSTDGIFGMRLKLAETRQEEAVVQFKKGDTLEVVDAAGGHGHKVGSIVTVKAVEPNVSGRRGDDIIVLVEQGSYSRGRTAAYARRFKLVEIEEAAPRQIKVGDLVEVTGGVWEHDPLKVGDVAEVLAVKNNHIGLDTNGKGGHGGSGEFGNKRGWWVTRNGLKLVEPKAQPKPKKQSQKITLEEVQVGDLIVAFRKLGTAEERWKDVVGSIKDGYVRSVPCAKFPRGILLASAESDIYLLERPEPKVPEIADGTYWVTEEGHPSSPWTVTVKDEVAKWEAADGRTPTVGYAHLLEIKSGKHAESFPNIKFRIEKPEPTIQEQLDALGVKPEDVYLFMGSEVTYQFIGKGQVKVDGPYGNFQREAQAYDVSAFDDCFELVVPKELSDLEKFEQAGYIGGRFKASWGSDLHYKVTAKGNIKGKHFDRESDTWDKVFWSFETFERKVDNGDLVKI